MWAAAEGDLETFWKRCASDCRREGSGGGTAARWLPSRPRVPHRVRGDGAGGCRNLGHPLLAIGTSAVALDGLQRLRKPSLAIEQEMTSVVDPTESVRNRS